MNVPMTATLELYRRTMSVEMLLMGCLTAGLYGCDSKQLPNESTLQLSPEERKYSVIEYRDAQGLCLRQSGHHADVPMLLSLRDGSGSPIGGEEVRVHVSQADNAFGPTAPIALYEDRNGNGIVDADSELASAEDDEIARIRLDPVNGSQAFLLRIGLSCGFRTEIFAHVGAVSAMASVEVLPRLVIGPDGQPVEDPRPQLDAASGTPTGASR